MAAAYKAVKGKQYKRVIILGISHQYGFSGASIPKYDAYETPLGLVPLDTQVRDALLKHPDVISHPESHKTEHSIENQLPFLQTVLKPGFRIVPIQVGEITSRQRVALADALRPYCDDQTLVVVSSDFSHVGSRYGYTPFRDNLKENIYKLDQGAIDQILAIDVAGFIDYVARTRTTICGRNPIAVLLTLLDKKTTKGKLILYQNSGDRTGDYSQLAVGYTAIVFTKTGSPASTKEGEKMEPREEKKPKASPRVEQPQTPEAESATNALNTGELSLTEQQTLLRLARDTLNKLLVEEDKAGPDLSQYNLTPHMEEKSGVFVTLKEHGRLRGCIGYIEPIKPLYEAVIDNANNAAFHDPRFPPVRADELKDITIEISVMSPLRRIQSVDEIIVGKHGLTIEKGFYHGVLLPQVPVEWGWDRDTFLVQICRKAGLPDDAWKEGAILKVFSAQVFGEKE
jgi:AmmeMemoRadiSam system protein A/AmmeMemoRadiSam system protein B